MGMGGAFDQIWDLVKARPQRPDYFMDVVPEGADLDNVDQMIQDSPTLLDVNVVGGDGDECCADLRNGLANLETWSLNHYKGLSGQINEAVGGSIDPDLGIEGASCEQLVEALKDAISYGEYAIEQGGNTVAYWKDYGFESEQHAMAEHRELRDDEDGRHEMEYLDRLRQLKLEYDACKMGGFDDVRENEATGFYASADPFEIAWDMVIKMPIRPGSLHQKRREYSYFNPKRKTKQEREKISPLMAVPIDEGDESDDDQLSYEAIYDHDDGFSHTPATIVGPEGIIAERVDTPKSSEIIAGREDKRVWGDPLSQRREWWLQGPHGDLYARRGDGKGNVAMEEGNQYRIEEGNLQGKDREKLMEYLEMLSTMMNQHGDELILDNDVRMMPNPDLERKS